MSFFDKRPQLDKHDCPKSVQRYDLFCNIRHLMNLATMIPLQLERFFPKGLHWLANLLDFSLEMFLYFTTIHIGILYVCTLYLYYGNGDLELHINSLMQTIIYFWAIVMKFYFRRMQNKTLMQLLNSFNAKYAIRSAKGFTYITMDESLAMANKYLNIFVISCMSGTIFWLVLPIAYGDRSLPLSCWYPFDYKKPVVYEILYFLQFVGQIQVAASFAGSSGCYMVLCVLISGQYDILFCSLKNLTATVYIELKSSNEDLKELERQQSIANDEVNQYFCSIERTVRLQCISHLREDDEVANTSLSRKMAFRNAIKNCVQHHQFIVRSLDTIEKFYNPIWFFKCGEVIFLMCCVAFVSVKSTTANTSFFKIITLGQYLLLVAWEMLIICYFGEIIYLNSWRCGEALLRSPWHLHMPETKSDILIFLLNAKRTFKLTAGKIQALNVERFRGAMTTAFSFLTLLQKMDQRS